MLIITGWVVEAVEGVVVAGVEDATGAVTMTGVLVDVVVPLVAGVLVAEIVEEVWVAREFTTFTVRTALPRLPSWSSA